MDKKCTLCQSLKDENEFGVRSDRGTRLSQCRSCVNELHRDSYSRRPQRNAIPGKKCPKCGEPIDSITYQAYCANCKNAGTQIHRDNNPGEQAEYYQDNRQDALDKFLLRKYGLTVKIYYEILESQDYGCAICGGTDTPLDKSGVYRRMPVDHNHLTGNTRGILCHPCNATLGNMHDSPALLRAAADYLERWSADADS